MVGISYPGIEQLYVARTQPPHLAAITPLSVLDDSYRGTLWPGGILNTGFAEPWASSARYGRQAVRRGLGARRWTPANRVRRQPAGPAAEPRPGGADRGQPVLQQDLLPADRPEPVRRTRSTCRSTSPAPGRTSRPAATSRRSSTSSRRSPHFYATMSNGSHTESLSLGESSAATPTSSTSTSPTRVPTGLSSRSSRRCWRRPLTGVTGLSLPEAGTDYSGLTYRQAKQKFEAQEHIRVLFEEGAAKGEPSGAPLPRFAADVHVVAGPAAGTDRASSCSPAAGWPHPIRSARDGAALVLGRPVGAADDRLPRLERRHLGRPPDVRLASRSRKGNGLGWITGADEAEHGRHRWRLAGRLGEDTGHGRRPRGDGERRAPQRQGGLRPERVAARQPSQARHEGVDGAADRCTPTCAATPDMPRGKYQKLRIEILAVRPAVPGRRPAPDHARRTRRRAAVCGRSDLDHGQRVTVATTSGTGRCWRSPSYLVSRAERLRRAASLRSQTAPPCRSLRSQTVPQVPRLSPWSAS